MIVHGGDAERVISGLDPRAVTGLYAGLAGYFRHVGRLPVATRHPHGPGVPALAVRRLAPLATRAPALKNRFSIFLCGETRARYELYVAFEEM